MGPSKAFQKLIANVGKDVETGSSGGNNAGLIFLLLIQVLPDASILSSKSTLGYLRMFKTISEFDKLKKAPVLQTRQCEAFINFSPI